MSPALRHLSNPNSLSSVLACPRCRRGPVTLERAGWMCGACSSGFPVIGEIPWLFPEPRQALTEWRGRLSLLTQHLASEATAMRASCRRRDLPRRTRRRLEHVGDGATRTRSSGCARCWRRSGSNRPGIAEATHQGLGTRLPTEQGLTNYYVNLHRDWAWGDEENAGGTRRSCVRCSAAGSRPGSHAGARRRRRAAGLRPAWRRRCAADGRHGFQSAAACSRHARCLRDATVELYEFPIAPRRIEDHAVLRRLSAPAPARDRTRAGRGGCAAAAVRRWRVRYGGDSVVHRHHRRAVRARGGAHQSAAQARRTLDQFRFAGVLARRACRSRESRRGDSN